MGNKNNSKLTIIDLGEDQKTTLARMASHLFSNGNISLCLSLRNIQRGSYYLSQY